MKPFRFQQFSIQQSNGVFKVGTDAILLGALANSDIAVEALEIGCGTGIISLMIAQRNLSVKVKALDISEQAVAIAQENFTNSPFSERVSVVCANLNVWKPEKQFNFIFTNPPYFEANSSQKDILARQQRALNFYQLIQKTSEILTNNGLFSIIIPSELISKIINLASEFHLFLIKKINIYGIKGGSLKRNILEFAKLEQTFQETDFYIEKSPRKFSDQYLELTKDFHVFNK